MYQFIQIRNGQLTFIRKHLPGNRQQDEYEKGPDKSGDSARKNFVQLAAHNEKRS